MVGEAVADGADGADAAADAADGEAAEDIEAVAAVDVAVDALEDHVHAAEIDLLFLNNNYRIF